MVEWCWPELENTEDMATLGGNPGTDIVLIGVKWPPPTSCFWGDGRCSWAGWNRYFGSNIF